MSRTRRIVTMPPIEAISGKFVLESETISSEKPKKNKRYFGAKIKSDTRRNLFYYRKNFNPPRENAAEREIFAFAIQWRKSTMNNSVNRVKAMADYKARKTLQGKRPDDYTLLGWVFAVRYAQKKANPSIVPRSMEYNRWPTE